MVLQVWQCLFDVCCYHVRNEPAIINVSGWCKLICVMGRVPGFAFREKKSRLFFSLPAALQAPISTFPVFFFFLKNRPRPDRSWHENPSFINTSIFGHGGYLSLSPLFCHRNSLFLLFLPPHSPTLPCSVLSSLAPCETPTQGLREMNGLILKGKEWSITWCTKIHTYSDNERHAMKSFWGTAQVYMLKHIVYTHMYTHSYLHCHCDATHAHHSGVTFIPEQHTLHTSW